MSFNREDEDSPEDALHPARPPLRAPPRPRREWPPLASRLLLCSLLGHHTRSPPHGPCPTSLPRPLLSGPGSQAVCSPAISSSPALPPLLDCLGERGVEGQENSSLPSSLQFSLKTYPEQRNWKFLQNKLLLNEFWIWDNY